MSIGTDPGLSPRVVPILKHPHSRLPDFGCTSFGDGNASPFGHVFQDKPLEDFFALPVRQEN